MSIGEDSDGAGGNSIWVVSNYVLAIRSRFAKQEKTMMSDCMNVLNQFRQQTPTPYKLLIITIDRINPQDFDQDLRLYESRISFTVKWLYKFK
jgi:hypothetical protein